MPNARQFRAINAVKAGYSGKIQFKVQLRNPVDNWGTIGIKIKTFETYKNADGTYTYYASDAHEGNDLIPNLKCRAPCEACK